MTANDLIPSEFENQVMKSKLTYTGIRVKDLDESIEFYTKVLGMKETGRSKIESAKGEVASLVTDDGGHSLELNYYEKGSSWDRDYVLGEEIDHIAFQVEDLNKFIEESTRTGYPVLQEMKTANSRWVYIQDPNGIWIEVFA